MVQKYLLKRGEIYYFRWKLPADLVVLMGAAEFKQSLATSNYLVANQRARVCCFLVGEIKIQRSRYMAKKLEEENYHEIVEQLKERMLTEFNNNYRPPETVLSAEERGTDLEYYLRVMSAQLATASGMISEQYGHQSMAYSFLGDDLDALDVSFDKRSEVFYKLREKAEALTIPLIREELRRLKEVKSDWDPFQNNKAVQQGDNANDSPLFSEVYEQFIRHKLKNNDLNDKVRKEYERYYKTVIELIGNKPIGELNRVDVKTLLQACLNLPKRNLKAYKGKSATELLELDIPKSDLLAPKSVDQIRKFLQGVFAFAVNDISVLSSSPVTSLQLQLNVSRSRAKLSDVEVNLLFDAKVGGEDDWKKWILLLAAYTGARRGELVQLRTTDIKTDQDSRIPYILITEQAGSLKTANSKRQVPLHSVLLKKGFIEYVKAQDERVFPGLKPEAVTAWFDRLRKEANIDLFDDFGGRKVFHSYRHSFITKAISSIPITQKVQQVVGHEKSLFGVTDIYTHRYPVEELKAVVESVVY
jgi:integrase